MREAQGIKDTDEDRRRDRNRKAMADAYDKSSMKARPALRNTLSLCSNRGVRLRAALSSLQHCSAAVMVPEASTLHLKLG